MNCPECRSKLPGNAAACPNCGCPVAGTNETVLKEGFATFTNASLEGLATVVGGSMVGGRAGNRVAGKAAENMGQNGHAVLTERRFVFGAKNALKKMTVGTSANFAEAKKKGKITFDIPLAEIKSVVTTKKNLGTVMRIEASDGAYDFVFSVFGVAAKCAEWEAAINSALGKG